MYLYSQPEYYGGRVFKFQMTLNFKRRISESYHCSPFWFIRNCIYLALGQIVVCISGCQTKEARASRSTHYSCTRLWTCAISWCVLAPSLSNPSSEMVDVQIICIGLPISLAPTISSESDGLLCGSAFPTGLSGAFSTTLTRVCGSTSRYKGCYLPSGRVLAVLQHIGLNYDPLVVVQ